MMDSIGVMVKNTSGGPQQVVFSALFSFHFFYFRNFAIYIVLKYISIYTVQWLVYRDMYRIARPCQYTALWVCSIQHSCSSAGGEMH